MATTSVIQHRIGFNGQVKCIFHLVGERAQAAAANETRETVLRAEHAALRHEKKGRA